MKVSYKNDLIYRSLTDFSLKISWGSEGSQAGISIPLVDNDPIPAPEKNISSPVPEIPVPETSVLESVASNSEESADIEVIESSKINGIWKSDSSRESYPGNLFTVKYDGQSRIGAYEYGAKTKYNGEDQEYYISAKVWNDKDQDGTRDRGEGVVARFDAKYFAARNLGEKAHGSLVIDKNKGEFDLLRRGKFFGTGKIIVTDYFFGGNTAQKKRATRN